MDAQTLARALNALGDAKRLRMVQEIAAAGELSCGQVAERFDLSQPTISHHLRKLTDAGVLIVREAGQHRFISINQQLIHELARLLPARLTPRRGDGARWAAPGGAKRVAAQKRAGAR